ncbi:hypothetical protein N7447_004379 [Penicillium robsamsonii]|uniref:uncharacterized protein n=1 Tax=Penicillium robsamsonii TaxID=1792511 RepID=UPI0025479CDB|nr:uncharacterized protein N7447_004379 [Penicillium robsamsonii]KAJ5827616.1 hypothetical protein N7447_004379 [Penicillium robsamsonii]
MGNTTVNLKPWWEIVRDDVEGEREHCKKGTGPFTDVCGRRRRSIFLVCQLSLEEHRTSV